MKYTVKIDLSAPGPQWAVMSESGWACWCWSQTGADMIADALTERWELKFAPHSCKTHVTVGDTRRTEYGRTLVNADSMADFRAVESHGVSGFGLPEASKPPVVAQMPVKGQETAFADVLGAPFDEELPPVSGIGSPNRSNSMPNPSTSAADLSIDDDDVDFSAVRTNKP